MPHANPAGRLRLAQLVVDKCWTLRRAAERWNCSVTTAKRWADRYRTLGRAGMVDRSSRPKISPHRTPTLAERRVIGLRVSCRWGPARTQSRWRPSSSSRPIVGPRTPLLPGTPTRMLHESPILRMNRNECSRAIGGGDFSQSEAHMASRPPLDHAEGGLVGSNQEVRSVFSYEP